jgi:hypothetical protein
VVAIMVAEFLDLWVNVVSSPLKHQRIKTILDKIGGVMAERWGR